MEKIKELQKRGNLNEGRNFGIGFSILNKIDANSYETYLPFTACKDYLNDFAYVESIGKEIGSIYGYNHKLLNCFKDKKRFYLGINTLHYNNGNKWKEFDQASKILIDNYKNLELFLNKIEKIIFGDDTKKLSKITVDGDTLIINATMYWVKNAPLISAYTLLIRCYFNIINKELEMDLGKMLEEHNPFIQADKYMNTECVKFYKQLLKDKTVFDTIKYKDNPGASTVHNFGIQGFLSTIK